VNSLKTRRHDGCLVLLGMNWERRLRDMILAGGALAAAACSGNEKPAQGITGCNACGDPCLGLGGTLGPDGVCMVPSVPDAGSLDAETPDGEAGGPGGYATRCPVFNGLPTCPAASNANGCDLALGNNCAAGALPQGVGCSGMSQCQALVGPVDGCGRVDGYICSCIDGRWSCDDCAVGAALCEGGAQDYELPESGTTGGAVDASTE
jgi:hypothetical protein